MISVFFLLLGMALGCILAARNLYHYFQLESYQFPGYFRTLKRNLFKALTPGFMMTVVSAAVLLLTGTVIKSVLAARLTAGIIIAAGGWIIRRCLKDSKAKKPFALTARVKRLYIVSIIVFLLILSGIVFGLVPTADSKHPAGMPGIVMLLLFPAFIPLWVALCGLLAWPVEKAISELYFRDAQRILRSRPDLIRVGITGSWGKTSVKFILGTILEEKYHTLVTPSSFNTPMGVTKTIRSKLEPGHRVFVSEMGARHVGDIREMCRLVHPQYGLLTSVGPQHLDTFKTLDRVAKTKYELIDAIPDNGAAFFADDQSICRELYDKTKKNKRISGLDPEYDDIWAEEIRYSPEGTDFVLCTADKKARCSTVLLGELNVKNILLCASAALYLGLSIEQIIRGISKVQPVEHRLQLIKNPNGITIIDDAFNSNIRGAKQAFETLRSFPGRRVVVTPGMVELGDREEELNREFGSAMASCCDLVILVGGKRSHPIRDGLINAGFAEQNIHVVSSLEEAAEMMRKTAVPGDTVLFENDLPDNYTE